MIRHARSLDSLLTINSKTVYSNYLVIVEGQVMYMAVNNNIHRKIFAFNIKYGFIELYERSHNGLVCV